MPAIVSNQTSSIPTQTQFNAFADAMSTSYGAPIELFSVDPASGAQTVLADTSITNLLAELPVLETQANGANLGLQLADGTQVQFASTAGTATFLYSLAVQQMQATSFVTDNYNLDMQWLNTVDQPLLEEASYWSERAKAETSSNPEAAIEDNTQASMAMQIAAEAPSNRLDMSVTIHNAATGNPTQITVYANGDGSTIHDVATNVFGEVLGAISTVVSVAALVTGNAYLYYAAAALDAANAGEDFSNGQDVSAVLATAAAISAGITGGAGGTPGTTPPPVSAQIINAAVQGVGGVYGVVQSAETGNGVGIFAGALEAAAAAASGIGLYEGGQAPAMLNSVATALGTIGLATNVGSAFASGNIALGLEDSLNLFLPALAQAYANAQTNQSNLQPLVINDAAVSQAAGNPAPNVVLPDFATATYSPTPPSGAAGVTETVRGATVTIYVAPASAASSGQTAGSAPLVVQIVPASTAQTPTITDTAATAELLNELFGPQTLATPAASVSAQADTQTLYSEVKQDIDTMFDTAKTALAGVGGDIYDLASNFAAAVKQDIVSSGLAPDLSGPHGYIFEEGMRFTTAQEASQYLLNHPGPGADYTTQGGVQDQQTTTLFGDNTIETLVFENGMHIQNITESGHLFAPGTVDRYVEPTTDGKWEIVDIGVGSGMFPTLNQTVPPLVFGDPIANLKNGHLIMIH